VEAIRRHIVTAGGWISFARYMEAALYMPGLGYYTAGARKFGAAGDFVTAPELTPLFADCLARQAAEIMAASAPILLEAGAGSGVLCADLLLALQAQDALPERYEILELSADLRERQRETLVRRVPELAARVVWREDLPEHFSGLVLGNEVLDAMPVHLVIWRATEILEKGVALDAAGKWFWQSRPATGRVHETAEALARSLPAALPEGYESELALVAPTWVAEWGRRLRQGALLLLDYGFPRHEFYSPEHDGGTLMCHYRHRAHSDPFYLPGLQDITAHVEFTSLADAAFAAGLEVLGYTDQASFLLNCGLPERLMALEPGTLAYAREAAAAQKLIAPQEMGERFKVIAFGKGMKIPLTGFTRGDRLYAL
jgi:SAM-dependent MidA family methyltransferase